MNENTVALAALGIVSGMFATMTWIIRYGAKTFSKDLKDHTTAANKQANTSAELAKAVKSFEAYLRQRNGTDHEVHQYLLSAMAKLPTDLRAAISELQLKLQSSHIPNPNREPGKKVRKDRSGSHE